MGKTYTKKDIPVIRQQIKQAKNWVVGSTATAKQKERLTQKIITLEGRIDFLERSIQQKDGTETYDFDAFQKDMVEHYEKAQNALKEAEKHLPEHWQLSAKECTGQPIAQQDFQQAQRHLLTAYTQLQAYAQVAEMFLISCKKTKDNKTLCIKDDPEQMGKKRYYEMMNRDVAQVNKNYQTMKGFVEGLIVDPKAPTKEALKKKKEAEKKLKEEQEAIKKGKMVWKSKTIATIKWGSQSKTIDLTHLKVPHIEKDIPHDVSGSLEILYKHAFFYDGVDTKYRHIKRVACAFVVDKKGVLSLTEPNEQESSTSKDFLKALGKEISAAARALTGWGPKDLFTLAKSAYKINPKELVNKVEKKVMHYYNQKYQPNSFSAVYESKIYSNGRLKGVATSYTVTMDKVSINGGLNVDGGIEIPFKATGDGTVGFTIEVPSESGKASGSISLMPREVPLSNTTTNSVVFEKEGQFDLDAQLEGKIDQLWRDELKRFEIQLQKEEVGKAAKNTDAKVLAQRARDRLDELIYKQKKYTIYLQGFASSTGDKSSNRKLSNKRAKKVVTYLVSQLNLDASKIFLKAADGEYTCHDNHGDNQEGKDCKKVTVRIKLGGS